MLRLAILSIRGRLGTFIGALLALLAASILAMAWGMQLESILRTHPPVERYAAATAVVAGRQTVGADHDVLLSERARVSSSLTTRLAAVPGVRAAIADVSVPARLGNVVGVARPPPGLSADRGLPDGYRGSAAGRPSRTSRRDRRTRRPRRRHRAAARGRLPAQTC